MTAKSLHATGAAPSVLDGVGDSLLPGFVVVSFPAPVPIFSDRCMSERSGTFPRWTSAAAIVAIVGNILATIVPIYSLRRIAPGSGVRLMAEAGVVLLISVSTLFITLPLAIVGLRREKRWVLGVIAICLAAGDPPQGAVVAEKKAE